MNQTVTDVTDVTDPPDSTEDTTEGENRNILALSNIQVNIIGRRAE